MLIIEEIALTTFEPIFKSNQSKHIRLSYSKQ